ncbi:17970_t:CDS:1, partial [Dentiscutata erythropus]
IWVYDEKPLTSRPIPPNLKPAQCFTHLYKNEKATHFFKAPNTTAE